MMKGAYAEKATLIADGPREKLYRIEIRLPNGERTVVASKGKDMTSALKTVLRTSHHKALSNVPLWVWLVSYMITAGALAYAAIDLQQPLPVVAGLLGVTFSIKLISDYYFRYVNE